MSFTFNCMSPNKAITKGGSRHLKNWGIIAIVEWGYKVLKKINQLYRESLSEYLATMLQILCMTYVLLLFVIYTDLLYVNTHVSLGIKL